MIKGGSGANTGFFIGRNEVIVIDSKMTDESAKQMIDEIRKLTPNPIRKILLTHSDRDHVNGLPAFPAGTAIVSHEETRRYMDEAFKGDTLRAFLPDITFASRATVYSRHRQDRTDLFRARAHERGRRHPVSRGKKSRSWATC